MNYQIFELAKPETLPEIELKIRGRKAVDDKNLPRFVLMELDVSGVENKHHTLEGATAEIARNSEQLKGKDLAIIPVVSIGWDESIY